MLGVKINFKDYLGGVVNVPKKMEFEKLLGRGLYSGIYYYRIILM